MISVQSTHGLNFIYGKLEIRKHLNIV